MYVCMYIYMCTTVHIHPSFLPRPRGPWVGLVEGAAAADGCFLLIKEKKNHKQKQTKQKNVDTYIYVCRRKKEFKMVREER